MKMLVVLDNTVLSNFAQARLASIVLSLWQDQVGTTLEALSEYRAGTQAVGLFPSAWETLQILETAPSEKEFEASLSARLGKGNGLVWRLHICGMVSWRRTICSRARLQRDIESLRSGRWASWCNASMQKRLPSGKQIAL